MAAYLSILFGDYTFDMTLYFSYFRNVEGMSKVDTPSPHSSKRQKKCGSCHTFLTDLDPHPDCSKCVPRRCSKESPCSHCAPLSLDAWKKWEHHSSALKGPLHPQRGPRGIQLRGGTSLGRYAQRFLLPPKLNLSVG